MTPQAIRDGFEHLRSDKQMLPAWPTRRAAAREADWLVGINGTRAMTAFNSRDGGFFLTTVGRVQTPTLSIVVEREEKIRKHVRARLLGGASATFAPRPASTRASGSTRSGRRTPTTPSARADRLWNEADAQAIAEAVRGQPATRQRGGQAEHAGSAAAVRPDHAAARGQLALRLLGQDHAVARAGAVREAQGADLPAHRQRARCPRTTSRSSSRRCR